MVQRRKFLNGNGSPYRPYASSHGNPHRGSHILAIEASEAYENARDRVVEFINAREREEVVFTRNSTESMNLIAHSYGANFATKGDKIVITVAEHHANLVTWQYVAEKTGSTLEYMYLDESGHLKDGEINKIDESTKIVAFCSCEQCSWHGISCERID